MRATAATVGSDMVTGVCCPHHRLCTSVPTPHRRTLGLRLSRVVTGRTEHAPRPRRSPVTRRAASRKHDSTAPMPEGSHRRGG